MVKEQICDRSDRMGKSLVLWQQENCETLFWTLFNAFILTLFSDNVKKALVQQGYAEHLANIVSSAKNVTDDESLREKVQSAADMIVMLLTEGQ